MGYGEPNHGTVTELNGALHQSLAEGSASYHLSTVLVLYCACDNLCRRCRELIDEHHYFAVKELSVAVCTIFAPLYGTSLCVNDKVVLVQELVGYVDGCLEVSTSVLL